MDEAGGKMAFDWDRAPVIPSCPLRVHPMSRGCPRVRMQPRIKEKGEFKCRLQTGRGAGSVCMTASVLRQRTLSSPLFSSTHRNSQRGTG